MDCVQLAFCDFWAGKRHHSMVHGLVEAVKVAPHIGIAQVEAAKMAPSIGLSPKCSCKMLFIMWLGVCAGGAR